MILVVFFNKQSWQKVDVNMSQFTPDITPLILAAHKNNYEILKILLDRGATVPTPHDVRYIRVSYMSTFSKEFNSIYFSIEFSDAVVMIASENHQRIHCDSH